MKNVHALEEAASAICPHCMAEIGELDHLCPQCGRPVTAHAATDPYLSIFAAGSGYMAATSTGKPKKSVVIAIWLIFGPQILIGCMASYAMLDHLSQTANTQSISPNSINQLNTTTYSGSSSDWQVVLALVLLMALMALYAAIIWKATHKYLNQPAPAPEEADLLKDDERP